MISPHPDRPDPEAESSEHPETRTSFTTRPQDELPILAGELHLTSGIEPVPNYVLNRRLGRGGFGEVWQATGPGGVMVAMKFIRLGEQLGEVELRSLDLMKNIHHPHLTGISGIWRFLDTLIIAMELGDRTLMDCLNEAKKQGWDGIPRESLIEYIREAAKAIDYLNAIPIAHRDIKPQNLLLMGDSVKVADFGLAKLLERTQISNSGSMTPAYAAPEFFKGQTSGQSDQYSLAVSYCQLRCGRLPFEGNSLQLMAGHLDGTPDLSMLPEVERPIVEKGLAKDPSDRWPDCRSFAQALVRVMPGDKSSPSGDWSLPPRKAGFPRKYLRIWAALVLMAASLAAAYFYCNRFNDSSTV